jgi:excisionase family DNA binding protein
MSIDEAATTSGIGRTTLRDAVHSGELRAVFIGRKIRIPTVELHRFVDEAASKAIDLRILGTTATLRTTKGGSFRRRG